jgi:hypothetical protein
MFVDLGGVWCNVDQIVKIEKSLHPATVITYVVTFSDGAQRGITDEEFKRIMNANDSRK